MPLLRPLVPGEALHVPAELAIRFSRMASNRRQAPPGADPRGWMIVERGGRLLGWVDLDHLYDEVFAVREVAATGPHAASLGYAMLDEVVRALGPGRLEAVTWTEGGDPLLGWLLGQPVAGGRFEIYVEKVYVRRSLLDWAPPPDPFTGLRVDAVAPEVFAAAFAEALEGSPNRDLRAEDPTAELAEMRAIEGDQHDPRLWELCLLDGEIVGVILGYRFPYEPREGTVTFIGTLKRARGRGLGRLLHARALTALAGVGATAYLCSTDVRNEPMQALYRANGCVVWGRRRQYVWRPDGG